MSVDLEAMDAPTDSESGDAQYNADVWELRSRITALIAELEAARKVVEEARAWGHDLEHDLMGALEAHDRVVRP
jgi:hypothetical protein